MTWFPYTVVSKKTKFKDIHFLQIKPLEIPIPPFRAGQYVYLKNPNYIRPDEEHPFSITSSPQETLLEFCIREYGNWTMELGKITEGNVLEVSNPHGNFTFSPSITQAIFLCGGVGVSPLMSILRDVIHKKEIPSITFLYGSRTPETIVYKEELEAIAASHPQIRIRHIFSDATPDKTWSGYHGFITKEIIEKEVQISNNPHWFISGPPIFVQKMTNVLSELGILQTLIHIEKV